MSKTKYIRNSPYWKCRGTKILHDYGGKSPYLDKDVNYFVMKLNSIGAKTLYSCSGHGRQFRFYILFESTYSLAKRIQNVGFFDVAVSSHNRWRLQLGWPEEDAFKKNTPGMQRLLAMISYAWEKNLKTPSHTRQGKD